MSKEEKMNVKLANRIVQWYQKNAVLLPWRRDTDPYHVWLSEIMLQQTRIEAVIPYYLRFLDVCPSVTDLAQASEETVLKLWEGLGYYSRARNLHKAAKMIVQQYQGNFPSEYTELLKLPGIGPYTAGAIASICFDQAVAAVDGNVLRILARILCLEEDIYTPSMQKQLSQRLTASYPPRDRGDYTQGLMELGQHICLAKGAPLCTQCPVAQDCLAHAKGIEEALPLPKKKKARDLQRKTVFMLTTGHTVALRKREAGGLLGGTWEFPNVEGHYTEEEVGVLLSKWGFGEAELLAQWEDKHVFTHIEWDMRVYAIACDLPVSSFQWASREELSSTYMIPTAFKKCLHKEIVQKLL